MVKIKVPEMGRAFVPPLAQVDLAHPVGVDWVPLVRVDHNLCRNHHAAVLYTNELNVPTTKRPE